MDIYYKKGMSIQKYINSISMQILDNMNYQPDEKLITLDDIFTIVLSLIKSESLQESLKIHNMCVIIQSKQCHDNYEKCTDNENHIETYYKTLENIINFHVKNNKITDQQIRNFLFSNMSQEYMNIIDDIIN